jgi:tRNA(Ile)-lysidine synthase
MQDVIYEFIVEHGLLSPGDRVLVGLSGGADSVALVHLLLTLSPIFPITVLAAHLDHGIRSESLQDADFVRHLCDELGIPLIVDRVDVPALARQCHMGMEEAARRARRDFLKKAAAWQDCSVIALGHHRGDQVETFVHRLLRGSGLSGLAAMRTKSGPFIRPLLAFTRKQILDYLAEQRLSHVEDLSNNDLSYTRNRIRHELLPRLRAFNPKIEEHLARLSRRIALEENYWQAEEQRLLRALGRTVKEEIWLDRRGLLALHPAMRARVIRRALQKVRGDLRGLAACHIEGVEEMLLSHRPQAEMHLPGAWAGRRYDQIWLRRNAPIIPRPFAFSVCGPGVYSLPCGGEFRVTFEEVSQGESQWAMEFDACSVPFPLVVRSFRAGDRFRPSGMGGTKKLKDFFIDAKIDRETRYCLPLVIAEEILWVIGVRRCEGLHPSLGCGKVLRLTVDHADSLSLPTDNSLVKSQGLC